MKRRGSPLPAGTDRFAVTTARVAEGIDRTAIRRLLDLAPGDRLRLAVVEARNLAAFDVRVQR
jgi:hypothetical protein